MTDMKTPSPLIRLRRFLKMEQRLGWVEYMLKGKTFNKINIDLSLLDLVFSVFYKLSRLWLDMILCDDINLHLRCG